MSSVSYGSMGLVMSLYMRSSCNVLHAFSKHISLHYSGLCQKPTTISSYVCTI